MRAICWNCEGGRTGIEDCPVCHGSGVAHTEDATEYQTEDRDGIRFVTEAQIHGLALEDLQATAAEYHAGQTCPLYAFQSTGAVLDGLGHAADTAAAVASEADDLDDASALEALAELAHAVEAGIVSAE